MGPSLISARRSGARALSMLVMAILAAGCTVVAGGSANPAPGLVPRPLTGRTITQALLGSEELSRAFKQAFTSDPNQPNATGGSELLRGNSQVPPDCAGVVDLLLKDTYEGSEVRGIALNNWLYSSRHPAVVILQEAVVALPTAHAADVQFARIADRWNRCGGASMTIGGDPNFTTRVGEVRKKDSVLSAPLDDVSSYMTMPEGRAIGVRVNCLLEVKIVYFGYDERDNSARHVPSAAAVAQLLMQKVSSLA
ncbi:sensor domain-containing protein [Mycobacterium vicinigordonae]|uniref:Sensor domain-containing protein n=1 Tax=Mycobacterium vicinigordonae TaxID=1719132 RepID=A0A7D6IA24_9MYCO|nr:sensor domain-containing protein [Mycobacterium vicinigordonae]QLL08417.1 sensor domain-containing protein [Mycobacterium vicinigordonae]